MGLGSDEKRMPTYYCSPKAKKNDKIEPHIAVTLYDEEGKKHEIKDQSHISGFLVGLGSKEFSPRDKPNVKLKKIIITLFDKGALFHIELLQDSHWGRTVMNSILGTPEMEVLKLGVWISKKDGQAQIGVQNNNEKTEWMFDWKTQIEPLIYEVEDPKDDTKMIKVYKKVNAMFLEAWTKHAIHVKKRAVQMGWVEDDGAPEPPQQQQQASQDEVKDFWGKPQTNILDDPRHDLAPPPEDDMPF